MIRSLLTRHLLAAAPVLFATLALLNPSVSEAHSRLKASTGVVPRSTNAGVKAGPCGGYARVATPASMTAGSMLTVTWEETIQHPGRYEFYFSNANDASFQLLSTVTDVQDDPATLPHQYSTTLTLPSTPCAACTLQMIQVMTENPASPTNYYSCADIVLTAATVPTPIPTNPTPIPADPNCAALTH